ncbi:hypothetical protein LGK97_09145 [Clostridium sp. CS001]|uniref:hypothetical protein n=1 Tax=Clostridium sp. CS001 TaxID=2880648 RepID=UPI001CF49A68|nr:hypothetical protein [Clostridium sp. CS001]MCB2289930.1 hypothetical protein [Clostridium sp. CS001]
MKYFNSIYNSFLWAMVVAITSFKSEWLEMRVNIGYIFFGTFIVLSVILSLISKRKPLNLRGMFTTVNLVLCVIYGTILYGLERLTVVPASILREGIHENKIPFEIINWMLIIIVVLGLIAIIMFNKSKQKTYK